MPTPAEGRPWEIEVSRALELRGWKTCHYGLGALPVWAADWLVHTASPLRWAPDMLAHRGAVTYGVDAKGGTQHRATGNYDVETSAIFASLGFEAGGFAIVFAFRDGRCIRPEAALDVGRPGIYRGSGSGDPFLLIPVDACQRFDDVFGEVVR
jgi:hypothetical protein